MAALSVPAPLVLGDVPLEVSLPACPAYNVGHYSPDDVVNANDRLAMVVPAPVGRATPLEISDAHLYTFSVNQDASLANRVAAGNYWLQYCNIETTPWLSIT